MSNSKNIEIVAQAGTNVSGKTLDDAHFTIGEISILISFLAMLVTILWQAAKLGAKGSELKSSFDIMDIKITHELTNLASKVSTNFDTTTYQMTALNLRIKINAARLKELEYFLIKQGFVPSQFPGDESS